MSSQTEQIKAKLSIAEVVGSYIKLEKAGGNFKARCPFHNEKTPSFYVSPARDSWHCFGCNKGGDIFSFVEEIEGLDFLGALETLAARAGIELKPVDQKLRSENDRLYAVLEEATKYYHTNLLQSAEAKQYLKDRKITEETVRSFRLGFARPDWNGLYDNLKRKGFSDGEMEKAGLIIASSQSIRHSGGRYYDRFRGRIMFPLGDQSGRIVGFSGRIIIATGDREEAKYINTPQTALYDKSRILFGYDKAKAEIRRQDFCILVEGQMDLISSHQAGVKNAVAVSGTALTAQHLNLIKRLTDNLVMSFDGDLAGINAARRGVILALNLDLEVKIALLPDGLDPADLVAQTADSWPTAIAGAVHIVDFCLGALGRQTLDKRALVQKLTQEVLPFVAAVPNSIRQAEFVGKVASFARVNETAVWEELKKIAREPAFEAGRPLAVAPAPAVSVNSRRQTIERQLFGLLFSELGGPTAKLKEGLEKAVGATKLAGLIALYEPEKDRLMLEAELTYAGNEFLDSEVDDLLVNLKDELLREELAGVLRTLAAAPGDIAEATLLKRAQEIGREREQLKIKN